METTSEKLSKLNELKIKKKLLVEKLQQEIKILTEEIETVELWVAQESNDINVGDIVLVKTRLYNLKTECADNLVYDKKIEYHYNFTLKGKIIKLISIAPENLKYHKLKTGYRYKIEFLNLPEEYYCQDNLFPRDYIVQKCEDV